MPLRHHRAGAVRTTGGERGTGIIGTMVATVAFLLLLLATTQLGVNLYAASTVTAAGWDSARAVAARTVDHDDPVALARAQARAEERFHRLVGPAGDDAELTWELRDGMVRLHVSVQAPGIAPKVLGSRVAYDRIDRTFAVRIERAR